MMISLTLLECKIFFRVLHFFPPYTFVNMSESSAARLCPLPGYMCVGLVLSMLVKLFHQIMCRNRRTRAQCLPVVSPSQPLAPARGSPANLSHVL